MKRKNDWLTRLNKAINRRRDVIFEWGRADCALFASDILQAMTGIDPAEWFRGEYDTESGAYKALRRSPYSESGEGFNDVFKSVVSNLADANELEPIHPNFLHRGDLVLVKQQDDLYSMGIWSGDGSLVISRDGGIEKLQRPKENHAWRVSY